MRSGSLGKSKNEDSEIESIEQHIQHILNVLIRGLQLLETGDATFDKFQDVFYKSESLEEYLSGLHDMVELLVGSMRSALERRAAGGEGKPSGAREGGGRGGEQNESVLLNHRILKDPHYENLEKVLQKYEAEIREHIRIEQQLKIYSDGLEEKVKETEKESAEALARLERRLAESEAEAARFQKLLQISKMESLFAGEKGLRGGENALGLRRDSRHASGRKVGRGEA